MKLIIFTSLFLMMFTGETITGQEPNRFGRTFNIGLGLGYYGYAGHSMSVIHANYEFNASTNFTLAPFISFYTYRSNSYINNGNKYYYHQTVVPLGVKGTYYFDDLLKAGTKWDFYLAGSLGFTITKSYWDDGYDGDRDVFRGANPLFLDFHIGTEYHINRRFGIFLDLSSGVSTIGLAIH